MSGSVGHRSRRIVWSPHEGQRLFLVGGGDLRLYEWSSTSSEQVDPLETLEDRSIHMIGVNPDMGHMKCFDWSPHSEYSDMVAIGYNTGRTVLTRLPSLNFVKRSGSQTFRAPLASGNSSFAGPDFVSGTNSYFSSVNSQQPAGMQILGEYMPRHTRACNVVIFCPTDPKLLAVGFEKVRNDAGLVVWDTETSARTGYAQGGAAVNMSAGHSRHGSFSTGSGGQTGPEASTSTAFAAPQPYVTSDFVVKGPASIVSTTTGTELDGLIDLRRSVSTFADKSAAGSAPASQNRPVPVAQFGSSEGISSAGWLYQSSPLLVAGMGLKWIRSYDMRVTQSTASMVIPTKAVLGIVADPFNGNRLASFAEDAIVRVWDIRKASEPALTINSEFRYGISHVAWSPQRAGCLAAAGKESTTLRVWDTQEGGAGGGKDDRFPTLSTHTSGRTASKNAGQGAAGGGASEGAGATPPAMGEGLTPSSVMGSGSSGPHAGVPGATPGAIGGTSATPLEWAGQQDDSKGAEETAITGPMLWRVRKVEFSAKQGTISFPTFAWIPMSLSDDFSHHLITACLDKDRILSIVRLPPTYRMSFCPLGSLAITAGPCVTVLAPTMSATKGRLQLPNTATLTTADADPIRPTVHVAPLTNNDVKASKSTQPLSRLGIARRNDLPRDDIAVIMRTRAVQGYAFDALANAKLFERCADTDLEDVWTWIHQLAKHIALGRFRIGHVEYAGQGVQTVVQDMLLSTSSRKVVHHDDGTRPSPTGSGSSSVRGPEPIFPLKTYTSPYRDLALLMCGWSFHFPPADRDEREDEAGLERDLHSHDTLDAALRKLQAGGEHEKAAGWALFHGSSLGLALEVLKSAKDERLKLVATAIAGYSASRSNGAGTSSSSSTWEDLCRSLSSDLKDPYLRAIFALIASNGNWRIVLQERGLSLRDRVGIALRFLSDEELVETINDMTAEMTSAGDVKGLLLTGLVTPTGMTLLETYINHCGDVQTAALLLLHTPGTTTAASASAAASSRVLDLRVDEWSEYYRALLDRWQLYHTRARFDIARHRNRNRQRVGGGAATASEAAAPPPHADLTPQIYVRCTFCNAPLAKAAAGDGGAVTAATAAGGQMASHGVKKGISIPSAAAGAVGNPGAAVGAGPGGGGGAASRAKMTACPTCRKPLPRCALCLLHLGTPADTLRYFGRRGGKANEPDTDLTAENKDLGFELWFTWCQTCRHGGHALHMLQWFEGHAVCPVSNCACRCREL